MNNLKNLPKTQIFFLVIALIIVVIIAFTVLFTPKKSPPDKTPSPNPTAKFLPPPMQSLPKKENAGIDLESTPVKASQQEITKLQTLLPYQATSGDIEVLIPSATYQPNAWTLIIQVSGVDYQITKEEADYDSQKKSFLEGARIAFNWILEKGANPEKIIILWGDKKFIQDKAEEWLKEQ